MRDWLTAQPYAHRGLHAAERGVIENTVSAFRAAIEGGYGIECDVQASADGEAMVFHDFELDRLTKASGLVDRLSAADLKRVDFKGTADRMATLGELCDLVAGRVPILVEIKSRFNDELALATRAAEVLAAYSGAVAIMSFDPNVIVACRRLRPALTRGIVAQRRRKSTAEPDEKTSQPARYALELVKAWPHFLAYRIQDLPSVAIRLTCRLFDMPLLTWTVRESDRANAKRHADQMIFEGFRP
jgi:glycerophosphoryl diester phosphodiesterase